MRMKTHLVTVLGFGLLCAASSAGELPARFTLGRYIPDNAWMFMNSTQNPERAWVEGQIAEVFEALKNSDIHGDVISLVLSFIAEGERADAQAGIDRATELIKAVRWGDLFGGEVAFAERISVHLPSYEYILLARAKEGSAPDNTKALVAILQEIASLADKLVLSHHTVAGVEEWSLSVVETAPHDVLTILCLFRKGDVIGLVFAPSDKKDLFDLLADKPTGRAIVDTVRFKKSIAQAKTPEHALMFFDVKELLRQMKGLFERLQAQKPTCCPEEAKQQRRMIDAAVGLCDVLDYSLLTMEMEGRRELIHSIIRLQEGKENSPLAKVFLDRKPFDRFDRYIPADATGFSINGFIDLEELYQIAIDFVRKHVPGGADGIAKWNEWLAAIGFDPKADVFSWWSGEIIHVTMSPAVVTPMGGSDFVLMIRVKDGALARAKINAAIDFAQAKLQDKGLMVLPADIDAEGFRMVTHPSLMLMGIRPVIGVKDDWLVLGSSGAAIKKCQAVASGEAPSIMKNERFRNEGIIPRGPVLSASFKDTSNFGQELAKIFMMVGGMGQLFVANLPDNPQDPASGHKKAVLQTALSTFTKLGPVLQKIDFYSSESSVTTIRGTLIREERVITYKGPLSDETPKTAKASGPLR